MNVNERNNAGRYYVNTRLSVARTKTDADFQEFHEGSEIHQMLTDLIEVKSKGFRGVVVTALTGIHLNDSYNPLQNFYACNPRAIFESGIWYALNDNGIPCGQSDPLNVAKNVTQLNEDWAQGKRPQAAALAAVAFLRLVMSSNKSERARLVDYFFYRLLKFSKTITDFKLSSIETSAHSLQTLGTRIVDFTLKYPESGNVPQRLVALLLSELFSLSTIRVVGGDESAFGTNTTSKKPADIWIEIDGKTTNLYEVTLKPVNYKRLDDSLNALNSTGHLNNQVTFICRFDHDVKNLELTHGSFQYKGKRFDFVDFKSFCLSIFALLEPNQCLSVVRGLENFIKDKNISVKTKGGWNEFFESNHS